MYYSIIGCFTTILLGWTISYFTGSESDLYDEELIHPLARKMAHFFPGKKRLYYHKEMEVTEKREKIPSNKSLSKLDQAVTVHAPSESNKDSRTHKEKEIARSESSRSNISQSEKSENAKGKTKLEITNASKSGKVNPTFSLEVSDEPLDGVYKTKL